MLRQHPSQGARRTAQRFLYHILWVCRDYLYLRAIQKCLALIKSIPCEGEIVITKEFLFIEKLIIQHDKGNYEPLMKAVADPTMRDRTKKWAKSLVWRLTTDSEVLPDVIERLKDSDDFVVSEHYDTYERERAFDRQLREHTSQLINALISNDKKVRARVIDFLISSFGDIKAGCGCASTYQRLYPFLRTLYELQQHFPKKIEAVLQYTLEHGSASPVRDLIMPTKLLEAMGVQQYFPLCVGAKHTNLRRLFPPTAGSYAESLESAYHLVKQADLLFVLGRIEQHIQDHVKEWAERT